MSETKIVIIILISVITFFTVIFSIGLWSDKISCGQEWSESGYPHRWSRMGGCQIQFSNGTWIPSKNFRSF